VNYNPAQVDPRLTNLSERELLLINTEQTKHTADTLKELKVDFRDHLKDFKLLNNVVGGLDCRPKMNPGGSTEPCSESDEVRKRRIIHDSAILFTHWAKRHPKWSGLGTIVALGVAVWMQVGMPVP